MLSLRSLRPLRSIVALQQPELSMRHRKFGRTGWQVSEVGYGMWGMGGWTGSNDEESLRALERAVTLGCNFFDTAWIYGEGHSERLLGRIVRAHTEARLVVATKIPPRNWEYPATAEYPVRDVYPPDHIREYTERSLENLGVDAIDLQQFHVWNDAWADDPTWQREVDRLKGEKLVRAFGISVNRGEPVNVLRALDTGLIDSVQVVYNIFEQAPEDVLFPYCQERDIAIIARVPFDEGSLTGTVTIDSTWPKGDFRNQYFKGDRLAATIDRVERLRPHVPVGMELPELALRFILDHPAVSTTIPGMRRVPHVERNLAASDGVRLAPPVTAVLRAHRWDR
jgi:aryl-alcohol dehydrogenase-like predicted oxidoreductase